jgi:hypothetical protein
VNKINLAEQFARISEYWPVAEREASVLLFEPATTLNTGDVRSDRTRETLDRI